MLGKLEKVMEERVRLNEELYERLRTGKDGRLVWLLENIHGDSASNREDSAARLLGPSATGSSTAARVASPKELRKRMQSV